jgi:Holliday junction resolvase
VPKYAGRADDIQKDVVRDLRALGYHVVVTSAAGGGFPDLVVARPTWIRLVELIGEQKWKRLKKTNGLTPAQVKFHAAWNGPPIVKARSLEEVLEGLPVEARNHSVI